jgi:simple sugar transport system permease protein
MMNELHARRVFKATETYLAVILIAMVGIVGGINNSFLGIENLHDLLRSGSIVGIMACGCLVVLVSGGIDVSFAAVATVAMYVTVSIMNRFGGGIWTAFLLSAAIGIVLGLVNAVIIAFFKVPAMIATLGTMNIYHGMLLVIGRTAHIAQIPPSIVKFGTGGALSRTLGGGNEVGLSYLSVVMIVVFIITWLILKFTRVGRGVYAVGGNREAARRVGFKVVGLQIFCYCYIGMLAGIAGLVNVSLVRYVNSFDLVGTELNIIAAVALGGASITGGRGTVLGTVLGVAILLVVRNCLVLVGIPSSWQALLVGIIILASIVMSSVKGKGRSGRWQ